MFKLKRVRVMLLEDGRVDSIVAVDVAGPFGRSIFVYPNLRKAVWDSTVWLSVGDLRRKPRRGAAIDNEETVLASLTGDEFSPFGRFGGVGREREVAGARRAAAALSRAARG